MGPWGDENVPLVDVLDHPEQKPLLSELTLQQEAASNHNFVLEWPGTPTDLAVTHSVVGCHSTQLVPRSLAPSISGLTELPNPEVPLAPLAKGHFMELRFAAAPGRTQVGGCLSLHCQGSQ